VLEDGRYDAFIVWADERDDARDAARDMPVDQEQRARVELQLTITSGAHKGEVLEIVASNIGAFTRTRDPIDLVGLPCTLVVERGAPRIEP
jgi:hypothetical protein